MIKRIFSLQELNQSLDGIKKDVLSGKIKSLAKSYGFDYPFLKFYAQTSPAAVISLYYSSAVIVGEAAEETALFLENEFSGEILTSPQNEKVFGAFSHETLYIMEYEGSALSDKIPLRADLPYEKVYDILKEGFNISFDDWYVDTCHRVRHGISKVYTAFDKATATEMFCEDGMLLISLVAVKKKYRGEGLGGALIKALSEKLSEKGRVFVICEKALIPFYEKNGYKFSENCIQMK